MECVIESWDGKVHSKITTFTANKVPGAIDWKVYVQKAQQLMIRFVDLCYRIAIPWKQDKVFLPDNYSMALSRLQSLEKCLQKTLNLPRCN